MATPRSYTALITRGFLPKEIPPAFSSERMARFTLPNPLQLGNRRPGLLPASEGIPTRFSIPTMEGRRRRLEIPSPHAYARLARLLGDNWAELGRLMDRSTTSLSRPVLNANYNGRALADRFTTTRQRLERLRRSSKATCTTSVDIGNFYGSIYTHSIDWAVRTKAVAKRSRRDGSLGHLLDDSLQSCRDRQTVGIAIGPETSRIVSEVLLAAIDEQFLVNFKAAKGRCLRYIDDVTLYASSPAMGVEFAELYSEVLESFDLGINSRKTIHQDQVAPPDPVWRHPAQALLSRLTKAGGRKSSAISALSDILQLAQQYGEAPLRYIMTIAAPRVATRDTWNQFEDFLGVIIRQDGLMLPHAHQWLLWAKAMGYIQSHSRIDENLHDFALHHAKFGHAWEVAYATNILTDLGSTLDTELANAAASMEADVVDLLLIEACAKVRRLRGTLDLLVNRASDPDAFSNGHWLAAYQVQSANSSRRTQEFAQGEWDNLARAGVSFFRDRSASPNTRWYQARVALRTRRQTYVTVP